MILLSQLFAIEKISATKQISLCRSLFLYMEQAKLKRKYLAYYRKLPVQKLAAASIGKDEDTIIRWRREDADFADQTEVTKANWALEKSKKVRSTEWLLERVMNDHFSLKRSEEVSKVMYMNKSDLDRLKNFLVKDDTVTEIKNQPTNDSSHNY